MKTKLLIACIFLVGSLYGMEQNQKEQQENNIIYVTRNIKSLANKNVIWETDPITSITRLLTTHKQQYGSVDRIKSDALTTIPQALQNDVKIALGKKKKSAKGFTISVGSLLATIVIGYKYGHGSSLFTTCLKRGLCACAGVMSYLYAHQFQQDAQLAKVELQEAQERERRYQGYRQKLTEVFASLEKE